MKRREFIQSTAALAALSILGEPLSLGAVPGPSRPKRLSQLAHQGTSFEGSWQPTEIEGALPTELRGTLLRIGPGSKQVAQTSLQHFFDGDALLTSLRIDQEGVFAHSRFVDTPARAQEREAGQMLYHEFGTRTPSWPRGYKDSPNIHVLPLRDRLLALSESSHPISVDPKTFDSQGPWNFEGRLSPFATFTAHPKVDPQTGLIYSYGITRSLQPELKVFKIDPSVGRLTEIIKIGLGGFFPVHDMLMTANHLIFVVSPLKVNLLKAATLIGPIADALEYDAEEPLRIFVVRKDGSKVFEVKSQPSVMIFHHVNAFESIDGKTLSFHSIAQEDSSAYNIFRSWAAEQTLRAPPAWIIRFEIDLASQKIVQRDKITVGRPLDFPCFDSRLLSSPLRYVHVLENDAESRDPLAFDRLSCWDLEARTAFSAPAGEGRTFGEPVFVSKSTMASDDNGWILLLGYDQVRNETFLEVREAVSLDFKSRVWLGRYLPLGFHGLFQVS